MTTLIQTVKMAVQQIKSENESFGYAAEAREIAAQVWHGYLTPMQRHEIATINNIKGSDLKAARACYNAVEALI